MKKMNKILLIGALFIASLTSAQVGIGNEEPKATLDVNKTSYAIGEQAGIAVTQLTGLQIEDMNTSGLKSGTLVYATSTSGAIDSLGFWYYTGSEWTKVGASSAPLYQNIQGGVESFTSTGTISDSTYMVFYNGLAGALTTPTPLAGKTFWVRNTGTNTVQVAGVGVNAGKGRCFVSDGTSWFLMTP